MPRLASKVRTRTWGTKRCYSLSGAQIKSGAEKIKSRASLGWALRLRSGQAPEGVCPYASGLDVQVLYVQGVFLDELAACLYVFAHERGENGFGFGDVFELH